MNCLSVQFQSVSLLMNCLPVQLSPGKQIINFLCSLPRSLRPYMHCLSPVSQYSLVPSFCDGTLIRLVHRGHLQSRFCGRPSILLCRGGLWHHCGGFLLCSGGLLLHRGGLRLCSVGLLPCSGGLLLRLLRPSGLLLHLLCRGGLLPRLLHPGGLQGQSWTNG